MRGTIVQVSIGAGGLPKSAISGGLIDFPGVEGDRHAHPEFHGGPRKAILLVASEILERLRERGYPLFYGALGENLTTRGIDVQLLKPGDRLRAGEACLEITEPRQPCNLLDVYGPALKGEIFDRRMKDGDSSSPCWGMSGWYAAVREPGLVRPGDAIEVVA
ncbi:MAG: MOSC domain-containing protein [Bryobacteraceae bacterium]|jgi:MOSC domain-containing protein YiiM